MVHSKHARTGKLPREGKNIVFWVSEEKPDVLGRQLKQKIKDLRLAGNRTRDVTWISDPSRISILRATKHFPAGSGFRTTTTVSGSIPFSGRDSVSAFGTSSTTNRPCFGPAGAAGPACLKLRTNFLCFLLALPLMLLLVLQSLVSMP